jgi:hypothetical protein
MSTNNDEGCFSFLFGAVWLCIILYFIIQWLNKQKSENIFVSLLMIGMGLGYYYFFKWLKK